MGALSIISGRDRSPWTVILQKVHVQKFAQNYGHFVRIDIYYTQAIERKYIFVFSFTAATIWI